MSTPNDHHSDVRTPATHLVLPLPLPMVEPTQSSRRRAGGGVAMSGETRPPRELLKRIGISGKEVVKIIKHRRWAVVGPHGLQQQKLYYLPGAREKEENETTQGVDFFVGEGELYAFILKQGRAEVERGRVERLTSLLIGGLRYLLPEEELSAEDESDVEPTQPSKAADEEVAGEPAVDTSVDVEEDSDGQVADSSASAEEAAGSDQRKWKRRKKLSTKRNKSAETTPSAAENPPPAKRRRKPAKKTATVDDEKDKIRVDPRVKLEQATCGGVGQQTEFSEYQSSLTAQGWRAQLLRDVDVHMLRSVAAVDRRQRALEATVDGQKKNSRPSEGVGPHVQDAAEILQELEGLAFSIRASQDDLSSMMESIIAQGERLTVPDRIDPVGRIGIPAFVSTGPGWLVLMRDIERYLLLFVAAVRRYLRTRKAACVNDPAIRSTQSSRRQEKRTDLRALQLSIEESKRELLELAAIVEAEVRKQSCEDATSDTLQGATDTSQGVSQSISGPVRADDPGA
ncbi:unnamed protein product [Phytophthora lilii]|uniref:Unnamed protein product n=1 Tax=Phytophthora lilii TaxID=2077276 RepID=A0A9W6U0Z9_9STRA|nr:unnamed protein product [Phytophthora lilii]